ncbi:MAG: phenylalanine--tRNA ligase subunit alpha [Parcubacteria group bacterium]|nr:phenylalanine--tRNA ligase subunit alpha [Parcubacteria group bacterium]
MDLDALKKRAQEESSAIKNLSDLEKWRVKYLGRKSELSLFFDSFKNLSLEDRKNKGAQANKARIFLTSLYEQKKKSLESATTHFHFFDITRPGKKIPKGHLHPITLVLNDIIRSFEKLGFAVVLGPEIETEYYNFDALRIPRNHPARDMWDTFWLQKGLLLRTHTSPMQIRYMEKHEPPFRIIVPGKCFRFEATDSRHEFQFHQVEGLMVDDNISLANFKFIIEEVLKDIFKNQVTVRFRPSYFPFVSPGLEVDIKLKNKPRGQWLEVMGAGMVHPDLFDTVKYPKNMWQGFAFGLGVERIAMIKYGIDDIRFFFNPDIRFLEQF